MEMLLPAHLWAIVSCGREAESCEIEQVVEDNGPVEGVYVLERWREHDGERCWRWTDMDGMPCARLWRAYFVRRMVWQEIDGRWYGEWTWRTYERDDEWDEDGPGLGIKRRWRDMGKLGDQSLTGMQAGGIMPQEVLICMLKDFDWGCVRLLSY